MKKLLLMLSICTLIACKKDKDEKLTNQNWRIESSTITPAITIGSRTSTDYMALMGPGSCEANWELSFAVNGTFSQGSNGALCDLFNDPNMQTSVTWKRNNDQIIISTSPDSPFLMSGNKLTRTTKIDAEGKVYALVQVYKAK
jgi:hypothetical protein